MILKKKNSLLLILLTIVTYFCMFFAFAACEITVKTSDDDSSGTAESSSDSSGSASSDDSSVDSSSDDTGQDDTGEITEIYFNKVANFSTGYSDEDGGAAERMQYNSDNGKIYLINGLAQTLDIITLSEYGDGELQTVFDEATDRIAISDIVESNKDSFEDGFAAGDIKGIAINCDLDIVAIAVQDEDYADSGAIVLLKYDGSFVTAYPCGVQPGTIVFAGNTVLTADEGAPKEGYTDSAEDPLGSVTVLDLDSESPKPVIVTFADFDSDRDNLVSDGVLLKKDTDPSADLEPEDIAVSGNYAYVSLQEANAIATLNIESAAFTAVNGLGFKDHSLEGNGLDLIKDDTACIEPQSVYGIYMPSGLDMVTLGEKTYIVTANEGDVRECGDYSAATKATVGSDSKVEVLVNSDFDGLPDDDALYVFGGRSFSLIDTETMEIVYDSGDLIEQTVAASDYAAYFNCNNTAVELDGRSRKKGPEPKDVVAYTWNEKTYVSVALERQGGAMTFDITDLSDVCYAGWANTRDYSSDMAGDVSPKDIGFIAASESPNGQDLVILSNEISGTVALYCPEAESQTYEMHESFTAASIEEDDETTASHLLIWSVFGAGDKYDGISSHDFITIYNPSDEAVDLNGYTVRYSSNRDTTSPVSTDVSLSGTLPADGYYVIVSSEKSASPKISFADDEYNQLVEDLSIDNKQYTIRLIDADENTVDLLGVIGDDDNESYETEAVTNISKQKIVIRTSATDTDNNAEDFEVISLKDATEEEAAAYKPVASVLS